MNIANTRRAAMAVAAASLLLTACRVPFSAEAKFVEQGPRAIALAGSQAMEDLTSVRVLGTADLEDGLAKFDARIDAAGNCAATFDFDHGSFQVRVNKQGMWVKADANYWRANYSRQVADRAIDQFATKWMTSFDKADEPEKLCDLDEAVEFTVDKRDTDDVLEMGEVEKIGDVEAVPITGDDGKDHITVWVDVSAPHRVIKVAPADDTNGLEAFFFDDFDAEFVVETPAAKDVVDVGSL